MTTRIFRAFALSCIAWSACTLAQTVSPPATPTSKTTQDMSPAPQDTAPDPSAASTSSTHGMMKSCMKRHAQQNDGSTKTQMRKACKAELKSAVDTDKNMAPK